MGEMVHTVQSHTNPMDQFCYSVKKKKIPLYLCGTSSEAGKSVCVCMSVKCLCVCLTSVFCVEL